MVSYLTDEGVSYSSPVLLPRCRVQRGHQVLLLASQRPVFFGDSDGRWTLNRRGRHIGIRRRDIVSVSPASTMLLCTGPSN